MNLELTPDVEARLQQEASRQGKDANAVALSLLDHTLPPRRLNARDLMRLPRAERERYLEKSAEDAAPLYNADLALPVEERDYPLFQSRDKINRIFRMDRISR